MDYVAVDTLICNNEDTVWGAVLVFFTNNSPSYKISFCTINGLHKTISEEFHKEFNDIPQRSFVNIRFEEDGRCLMNNYRKVNLSSKDLLDFNFDRESIFVEPYKLSSLLYTLVKSNARYIPAGEVPSKSCITKRYLKDIDFDEVTLASWINYSGDRLPVTSPSGNFARFNILIHSDMRELFSEFGIKFTRLETNQDYLVASISHETVISRNTDLVRTVMLEPFVLQFVGVPVSMLLVHQRRLDSSLIQYMTYKMIDNGVITLPPISRDNVNNSYKVTKAGVTSFPVFRTDIRRLTEQDVRILRDKAMQVMKDYKESNTPVKYHKYDKYLQLVEEWGEIPVYSVSQAIIGSYSSKGTNIATKISEEVSQVINSCIVINIVKKAVRLIYIDEYKEILEKYDGILDELSVQAYKGPGVFESPEIKEII